MNLYEGVVSVVGDEYQLQLGDQQLTVPQSVLAARPDLEGYLGQSVVVGIRPEDLEDAALGADHPADQRLHSTIEVREALGAETLIHFNLAAPVVDSGDPDALEELGQEDAGRCTGRFGAASRASVGDQIEINVTTEHLHFFDRKTHVAIRG